MLSNGPPIPDVKVRVLDEQGNDLPDRHVGEIALHSNCMLNSYYNRPDATQKAFMDGWYLTGDFGYRLDGELYVSGRKKDLIIVGGKNIYPQDLEMLAMEAPGVHPGRVAAFGLYNDETGTEDVVLLAEVDTEDLAEQESIAHSIRNAVTRGSAVALRTVLLVSPGWLIKTSSGKTARSANREKYLTHHLPPPPPDPTFLIFYLILYPSSLIPPTVYLPKCSSSTPTGNPPNHQKLKAASSSGLKTQNPEPQSAC